MNLVIGQKREPVSSEYLFLLEYLIFTMQVPAQVKKSFHPSEDSCLLPDTAWVVYQSKWAEDHLQTVLASTKSWYSAICTDFFLLLEVIFLVQFY